MSIPPNVFLIGTKHRSYNLRCRKSIFAAIESVSVYNKVPPIFVINWNEAAINILEYPNMYALMYGTLSNWETWSQYEPSLNLSQKAESWPHSIASICAFLY